MATPNKTSALWGPYLVAPALDELVAEVDAAWPNRSKASDGNIGDKHHKPPSGHLPDQDHVVRAEDLTAAGIDMQTVIHQFILDPRAHYAIHKGVIWSRSIGFKPATYHGDNPHDKHAHLQVLGGALALDTSPWGIHTPADSPAQQPTFPGGRVLYLTKPRMRGDDVAEVQRFIGEARCGAADGVYGPKTASGVRWYQQMRGIRVDGVVGPVTWANLHSR